MIANAVLRLNHLSLRNFRCFSECEIDLHPELTVLVAENGRGKTAVLDAIRIALGLFVDSVSDTRQFADIDRRDVRLVQGNDHVMNPALPTELEVDGYIAGELIHWLRARKNYGLRASTIDRNATYLVHVARQLRDSEERSTTQTVGDPPLLPFVAFYATNRLWADYRITYDKRAREMHGTGRMLGYSGCLSSSASIKDAADWYEQQMNAARDPRSSALRGIERPEKLLAAVREATRVVLDPTGWSEIDWDFGQRCLVVEHPAQGRLSLSALSDGIRTMIALVMDIARRCAILNPHLSDAAARVTPGVVLIDEIDMHLHPRWQQQIVDLLRQAFPAMQIVLSTHSPHVLSTVEVQSIRIIHLQDGKGSLETPKFQTRGVESADILAAIMGVDPVPQVEEARLLSEYRALVQEDRSQTNDGQQLWGRLVEHFGEEHPVIQEIETMRRLEGFKRLHHLPRKEEL